MNTLKFRAIASAVVWIVIVMAVAWYIKLAVLKDFVETQFREEMAHHLDELNMLLAVSDGGKFSLTHQLSDPRFTPPLSGFYWEVQKDGRTALRSKSLRGPMLVVPDEGGGDARTITGPTGELLLADRVIGVGDAEDEVHVVIGINKSHLEASIGKLERPLFWMLCVIGLLLAATFWLQIIYVLRPIDNLRCFVADFRRGANANVGGRFPDELQPLVDDLNGYIASTRQQISKARTQAGRIQHGVRTALAILVDEGHQIEKEGQSERAAIILAQCNLIERQINHHAARARAAALETGSGLSSLPAIIVPNIGRAFARLYVDRGLAFKNEIPADIMVACDSSDLTEMLGNLVDNAYKHAKTRIVVRVGEDAPPTFVRIVVEDDGPGLPQEKWDVVFETDEQWTDGPGGLGLGLPIVREIARQYDGEIRLDASEHGGLKVVLDLPAVVT